MPEDVRTFYVFVAHPADVREEIGIIEDVARRWNLANGQHRHIRIEIKTLEKAYPAFGDRAQALVNRQLLDRADFVVGIFWARFGSPSGACESGTKEEIDYALERGKEVAVYFSKLPVAPELRDSAQLAKIAAYKEQLGGKMLYFEYEDLPQFRDKFERHLGSVLTRLRRFSLRTRRLAALAVLVFLALATCLVTYWQELPLIFSSAGFPETDSDALSLFSEALVEIKSDRLVDADKTLTTVEGSARTPLVKDRATALRLLLAAGLSEGEVMMGESIAKGQRKSQGEDQVRLTSLAISHSMQGFNWAKRIADSLNTLSSRGLPEIRFSKVELSDPVGGRARKGIEERQRIEQGGSLIEAQVEEAAQVLTSQALRFYVAKAFRPDAAGADVVAVDLWSGSIRWSPGLTDALYRHLTKMADKCVQINVGLESQPEDKRFTVGRNVGLEQELDRAFCRGLLDSLRSFLVQAQTQARAGTAEEMATLADQIQDVDRRLLDLDRRSSKEAS